MAASKRFTTEQIVAKLRDAEKLQAQGATVPAVCKRLGISEQTFYRWRIRYGRLKEDEAQRLKALEAENARLKRIVAEQALDISMLKDLNRGNGEPGAAPGCGGVSDASASCLGAAGLRRGRAAPLEQPVCAGRAGLRVPVGQGHGPAGRGTPAVGVPAGPCPAGCGRVAGERQAGRAVVAAARDAGPGPAQGPRAEGDR